MGFFLNQNLFNMFKDIEYIVTHSGRYHADDVLSVAIVNQLRMSLLENGEGFPPLPVKRVTKVMPIELESKEILVLDIGHQHDRSYMNFDHHQSIDVPATCMLITNYAIEQLTIWMEDKDNYKYGVYVSMLEAVQYLQTHICSYVSKVDIGLTKDKSPRDTMYGVPTLNAQIRSWNSIRMDFDDAVLKVTQDWVIPLMHIAFGIRKAKNQWMIDGIAFDKRYPSVACMRDFLPLDGPWQEIVPNEFKYFVTENSRGPGYVLISRDSKKYPISEEHSVNHSFLHASNFLASYPDSKSLLQTLANIHLP